MCDTCSLYVERKVIYCFITSNYNQPSKYKDFLNTINFTGINFPSH